MFICGFLFSPVVSQLQQLVKKEKVNHTSITVFAFPVCPSWPSSQARCTTLVNSSEAKDSRVIICKFPVKLPFPVYSGLQRASKSRHRHSCRLPSADRHCIMCACVNTYSLYTSYSVLGLRSVMTTALDSDERLV